MWDRNGGWSWLEEMANGLIKGLSESSISACESWGNLSENRLMTDTMSQTITIMRDYNAGDRLCQMIGYPRG